MVADLRNELATDLLLEDGHYGEVKVFVDSEEVVSGGALAFAGVLPSVSEVRQIVSSHLAAKRWA